MKSASHFLNDLIKQKQSHSQYIFPRLRLGFYNHADHIVKTTNTSKRVFRYFLVALALLLVLGNPSNGKNTMTKSLPKIGAYGADVLRRLFGDQFVADLEAVVYNTLDKLNQRRYELGLKDVESPWQSTAGANITPAANQPPQLVATGTPAPITTAEANATAVAAATPAPTAAPPWKPQNIKPFTKKQGEGEWTAYLKDGNGNTVAYRTFLSPDLKRPYVSVGVVAFDLNRTKLHFLLGFDEPRPTLPVTNARLNRTGRIPSEDAKAKRLLAAFNGGFKAQHGNFGVMISNTVLLPPRDGFATVALQKDGGVRIGAWGRDVSANGDYAAWRQNGPPILENGKINPLTNVMTAANWGAALDGTVAVWRSALGIDKNNKVLYFAAGDGVILPTMADALLAAGADDAMQLDINNYWVHFTAVRDTAGKLNPEPLFDSMKPQDPNRFLNAYSRDFFYVTVRE